MTTRESIKRFDWMGVVLYPLAVILMESFWVYPWLSWIGGWPMWTVQRSPLHLISVVLTLAVALAATRYLAGRDNWKLGVVRGLIIGLGVLVALLVLRFEYNPPEGGSWFAYAGSLFSQIINEPSTIVLGALALLYLWWRGINLGGTTTYFKDIYRSFIIGMVSLIVLLIAWQISSGSERFAAPGANIGWNVIAFFFFGLLAIAVCHLYNMRSTMAKEDAAQTSVWRWLPIMLGVIGGMVLLGLGLAAALSPDFFQMISSGLKAVGWFFGKIIEIIAIPLDYVFEAIIWILKWLISRLRNDSQEDGSGNMTQGNMFDQVETVGLPVALEQAIKWIVIIAVVALVVFILSKAVKRFFGKRQEEEIEEIHESVWDMAGLKDDLKSWLDGLKDRLTFKRKPSRYWTGEDDLAGNLDIREIYRRILREGTQAGFPRKPHETVEEYARRVGRYIPAVLTPLEGIDGAYEEVRYGDSSLKDEQVKGANSLWQQLRRVIRGIRGES